MKVKEKSIEDYKFDEHNFNQHTEEGMELLDKSIEQFGFGRSTLADKNGVMVGGNGVLETAIKQGKTKVIEIETDGTELVVVKRKDIDINTKKGRELAYADNKIAQKNLKWNDEEIKQAEETWDLNVQEWGGVEDTKEEKENYTRKIEIPIYEPKKENQPQIRELYDEEKAKALRQKIKSAKIPKEIKDFLNIATYRHVVFDYEQIAEYYAHADKDVQELMEESALVIIDFDKAIENGYVKYCKDIIELYKSENDYE